MTRYFIQLSYNGTRFHGWQVQPNAKSVQEELTKALSTILREEISVTGCGRTDTGVHASYFIAHFNSQNYTLGLNDSFVFKLNRFLPKDIAIQKIIKVNPDAHARFDALSRTYKYYISLQKDPFTQETFTPENRDLDVRMMNKAAELLFNYIDFTSFSKLHTDVKTNNCVIMEARWTKCKSKLIFTIKADRFLRNMVRAIVGTMIDVGLGKISLEEFAMIIEDKDRGKAGVSAPPQGLFLYDIEYPPSVFSYKA